MLLWLPLPFQIRSQSVQGSWKSSHSGCWEYNRNSFQRNPSTSDICEWHPNSITHLFFRKMISLIWTGQILQALFCDYRSLTLWATFLWFICPCQDLHISQDNKKNNSDFLFKTQAAFKPHVWIKLLLKHKHVPSFTSFRDCLKSKMYYFMQYSLFVFPYTCDRAEPLNKAWHIILHLSSLEDDFQLTL